MGPGFSNADFLYTMWCIDANVSLNIYISLTIVPTLLLTHDPSVLHLIIHDGSPHVTRDPPDVYIASDPDAKMATPNRPGPSAYHPDLVHYRWAANSITLKLPLIKTLVIPPHQAPLDPSVTLRFLGDGTQGRSGTPGRPPITLGRAVFWRGMRHCINNSKGFDHVMH